MRVHKVDVLTCPCGGRLRVIAFVTNTQTTRRILDHLGLPSTPPVPGPARAPPQPDFPGEGGYLPDPSVDPKPALSEVEGSLWN